MAICKATKAWQIELQAARISLADLFLYLELDLDAHSGYLAKHKFELKVTQSYMARIEKGNLQDPLLLQILPQSKELDLYPDFGQDPLGEKQKNILPGLIHKYHGRVLVMFSGLCAIHCRYCFRREFPYNLNLPGQAGLVKIIEYLSLDPSIEEVILSGGDPLSANDAYLGNFIQQLVHIPHLTTLRIHSRLPIVLPSRITKNLIKVLTNSRLKIVMVMHCNHPNELDMEVRLACQQMSSAGIVLLNQSVLLRGINDQVPTLKALSQKLFSYQIMPYYLHLLDKVQGAQHFDLDLKEVQAIMASLINILPGYLVPKLVREQAGAKAKVPILIQPA